MKLVRVNADHTPSRTDYEARKIWQVATLTRRIRSCLEGGMGEVWVRGEISNFRSPQSGHWYFSLKDESAQLSVVMFRPANLKVPFEVADGLEVILFGRITVYERNGQYQLIASALEPKGVGALQMAFEDLKKRLHKEGLFDESRKQELPLRPERIGLITSRTGAAIRDFLETLKRGTYGFTVTLVPVAVQGDAAAPQIVSALKQLNSRTDISCIVITRGGGSLEDLWPFNEESVARALGASRFPVISAVGHEIDWTISDFVSDVRAATPTQAAQRLVEARRIFQDRIEQAGRAMQEAFQETFLGFAERLERMRSRPCWSFPLPLFDELAQRIDGHARMLEGAVRHRVEHAQLRCRSAMNRLEGLSPLGTLSRGYTLTRLVPGKALVRSAKQITPGDRIETCFGKGRAVSEVLEVCEEQEGTRRL